MDFRRETVAALAGRVRTGDLSARELTQHALERIEALNPTINAFVAIDGERAMADAGRVDDVVAAGDDPGPLAGIPIGVKDLEDAAGFRTTYGSVLHADDAPATRDSVLVARLKAAGCVVVGKTNTPERGHKGETDNTLFGVTRNPWNAERTPGGSSGGSSAAIAAGMVPLATGSDGGGSIRIPSAMCGLTGMKPSLGRVPSGGPNPPDWPDISTKGPMARRARDVALALEAVVGPDPSDLRSLPIPEASWLRALDEPAVPTSVAWSPTLGYHEPDPEVRRMCETAVEVVAGLGATVEEVTVWDEDPVLPWVTLAATYLHRTLAEVKAGPDWDKVDGTLRAMVDGFGGASGVDFVRGVDAAHRLNSRLVDIFRTHRLLLCPTTAYPPIVCGAPPEANWVRYTYPFNMTRSPAGTVCAGFTVDGLPVGLQVVGPQLGDIAVLRALAAIEDALAIGELAPI